ncbi:hypothetical protein V2S66_18530 [Streptomyces sp. V4-01]|uniref:Uncharacterized protein n=1 Tax=Actinacidiphila polyblastidii TaxID=3110430 RepID=A0ABU7PDU7_9ACTN|nr:hypothetical protein [Streptomyces sp. V4-01]
MAEPPAVPHLVPAPAASGICLRRRPRTRPSPAPAQQLRALSDYRPVVLDVPDIDTAA